MYTCLCVCVSSILCILKRDGEEEFGRDRGRGKERGAEMVALSLPKMTVYSLLLLNNFLLVQ